MFSFRGVTTKQLGDNAEHKAENFLNKQGLLTQEKNFRCKGGEIDLIMRDEHSLIFVEVRYRKSATHGSGLETVNHQKQKKLIHAASVYLQNNNLTNSQACRFDVVSIAGSLKEPTIEWIKNAFSAQ